MWHLSHRSRRTSHDLVLIFPTWPCMSCHKLLQSLPLRHLHYLIGISLVQIWLLYVLYLVVGLSFNPLAIHCNRRREIVLNNKLNHYFWNSIGEFNHCLHRWERQGVLTKSWKYLTRDNSTFRECTPLRTQFNSIQFNSLFTLYKIFT